MRLPPIGQGLEEQHGPQKRLHWASRFAMARNGNFSSYIFERPLDMDTTPIEAP